MKANAEPVSLTGLTPAGAAAASDQRPFWHRADALLAVTHLDPDHALLKQHFPTCWWHLLRVKAIFDAIASLEAPQAVSEALHHHRVAPLLDVAAQELIRAAAEETGRARTVAAQARVTAERLSHYARTGEWQPLVLRQPDPAEPWLYCGPLRTWKAHAALTPLTFLLVSPRPDLQTAADTIDDGLAEVQAAISHALGGSAELNTTMRPMMRICDLLLAGGESVLGHKHFAHFFPLETPAATVDGPEFTIVFSNVHANRLRRCSMELLKEYSLHDNACDAADTLRASLTWFRGHDLGHFWRLPAASSAAGEMINLSHFDRMLLEEAYSDILGLVSASSLIPCRQLSQAFASELLRYLSRDFSYFADSDAAALTIGWLATHGVMADLGSEEWLAAAIPPLSQLARLIHAVLWENSLRDLTGLRTAFMSGRTFYDNLSNLYLTVPTDIEFTFG